MRLHISIHRNVTPEVDLMSTNPLWSFYHFTSQGNWV